MLIFLKTSQVRFLKTVRAQNWMVKADPKHTIHVNTKVIITEVPVAAMVNNGSTHMSTALASTRILVTRNTKQMLPTSL